jgi:hypothetical protein
MANVRLIIVRPNLTRKPRDAVRMSMKLHTRQDWPRFSRPSRTASCRRGMPRPSAVEADLQNVAIVAIHQPSCYRAGEGYGPKAAHTG